MGKYIVSKDIPKKDEEFTVGMMIGYDWKIRHDEQFDSFCDGEPCPHCYDIIKGKEKRIDGSSFYEVTEWKCQRVLSITPDDPYHGAMVCLDCLLKKLEEEGITDASSG